MAKKKAVKKTVVHKKISSWDKRTFNAAWIISLVLAFGVSMGQDWASYGFWTIILVALGIIAGMAHSIKKLEPLILAAVALAIFSGSSLSIIPYVGTFLNDMITYFISFLTPAVLIIALREIYSMFN